MKLTHRFAEMTPDKRPQDPHMDGTGLRFETLDHGGEYPDSLALPTRVALPMPAFTTAPPERLRSGRDERISIINRTTYYFSKTATLLIFSPFAPVPSVVTVKVLPSLDTTLEPVRTAFPSFERTQFT
jgi:hypothetical protein